MAIILRDKESTKSNPNNAHLVIINYSQAEVYEYLHKYDKFLEGISIGIYHTDTGVIESINSNLIDHTVPGVDDCVKSSLGNTLKIYVKRDGNDLIAELPLNIKRITEVIYRLSQNTFYGDTIRDLIQRLVIDLKYDTVFHTGNTIVRCLDHPNDYVITKDTDLSALRFELNLNQSSSPEPYIATINLTGKITSKIVTFANGNWADIISMIAGLNANGDDVGNFLRVGDTRTVSVKLGNDTINTDMVILQVNPTDEMCDGGLYERKPSAIIGFKKVLTNYINDVKNLGSLTRVLADVHSNLSDTRPLSQRIITPGFSEDGLIKINYIKTLTLPFIGNTVTTKNLEVINIKNNTTNKYSTVATRINTLQHGNTNPNLVFEYYKTASNRIYREYDNTSKTTRFFLFAFDPFINSNARTVLVGNNGEYYSAHDIFNTAIEFNGNNYKITGLGKPIIDLDNMRHIYVSEYFCI